jgi:hypothetical protein
MNRVLASLLMAAAALAAPAARAGTDVGVSIGIAQPGLYGRIDIGTVATAPVLVYPTPVVVVPAPVVRPPVYMYVPPGHAKNWRKHCRHYGACGVPVYFVRDDWYARHYAPAQARHGGRDMHPVHRHKGRGADD